MNKSIENLFSELDKIQHYCHNRNDCKNCLFNVDGKVLDECVFCGFVNIDTYPPEKWNLKKLNLKIQALEKKGGK